MNHSDSCNRLQLNGITHSSHNSGWLFGSNVMSFRIEKGKRSNLSKWRQQRNHIMASFLEKCSLI